MRTLTPLSQFLAGFVLGAIVMLGASMYTDVPESFVSSGHAEREKKMRGENNVHAATSTTSGEEARGEGNDIFGPLPPESKAEIVVEAQPAGGRVHIAHVVMPEDGWVVVHEVLDGHISNALGATRRIAGVHEQAQVELLRNTIAESVYVVVLYSDNGNGTFELNADLPIVDSFGEALIQEFRTLPSTPN